MCVSHRSAAALAVLICVFEGVPASAETLQETLRDAYFFDPSLESQRAQLQVFGEDVAIAAAGRLPSVTATGSLTADRTFGRAGGFSITDTTRPLSLTLSGSLPLYDGGETANEVSQARATVDQAHATLRDNEQALLLAATTAFFDVLQNAELRDLARMNLELLLEELDASETRFEVGEVTLTDVAQTRSSVAEANSDLVQADGNLRISAEAFRVAVGRLPGDLEPPEFLPTLPETLAAAEAEAKAHDPAIFAARAAERVANFALKVAQANSLPELDLNSTLQGVLPNVDDTDDRSFSAQLNLTFTAPIFQGGAISSSIRRARFVASQMRSEFHAAVRMTIQNVTVAWTQLNTAKGAIEAGKERVRAANVAFEGVSEELLVGSRATIDLLDAQQERLAAQIALVMVVRDLNVAAYTLLAGMGRFTPEVFGIQRLTGGRRGLRGAEPINPFAVPNTEEFAWRFPWRP